MPFGNATNNESGSYGDGSDGSQTYDGSTTILGMAPVANVYTLTRDIFLLDSTIDSGVIINTNGFRIFNNGILTNNGTIRRNGNNAVANVAGAVLSNFNSSINAQGTSSAAGTAGGAGQTGAGSNGVNSGLNSFGGRGGSGGAGASAGGVAGTQQALTPNQGSIRSLPQAIVGNQVLPNTGWVAINAGTGGGGGGGDGVVQGGGGGSGAGIMIIAAYLILGTGNIQANGGDGGNAVAGGTNNGGGGGGGGGVIIIISQSVQSGAVIGQTISVAGGNPGTGLGAGANGLPGNIGTTIMFNA